VEARIDQRSPPRSSGSNSFQRSAAALRNVGSSWVPRRAEIGFRCLTTLLGAGFHRRRQQQTSPIDSLYVTIHRSSTRMSIRRNRPTELLQGTLDLLILQALGPGQLHGLDIAHRIEQITNTTFEVKPGSLFPALHSMEEAGWLASSWGESEKRRKAKFYRLTKAGRR